MKVQSALRLASQGFRVFPLAPNSKIPPKDLSWKEAATTDPATIDAWWREEPDYNIGIAGGRNLFIADADCSKGRTGLADLAMLDMLGLPDSLRVDTPSGGRHVYLTSAKPHRNRVGTIPGFPGLDVRAEGGYVVGPGSTIDGATYTASGGAVAPSPAWLDDLLLAETPRATPKSDAPLVELDKPENVQRAAQWLASTAEHAVEGAGGDAATYRVATRMRDFGLSKDMALDVMLEHWNEQKASPPWTPDELAVKIDNAFDYATGGWGAMTAAGDFDPIEIDVGAPPPPRSSEAKPDSLEPAKKRAMHFLTYDEMCAMPEPEWLVEGVIQKRSAALLFGKSNTFKSFLAIDLGLSVAAGIPWHGNPVSQGRVLIVATEGANGVGRKRVPGWFEHHEVPAAIRHNVRLYPTEISLDVKEDVDRFIASAKSIGEFSLIILDIFGGTMAGTEVEDTTARAWVRAIQRIMRETGAATLTAAHTGWQDETRARMHTHFWGSFDSRMRVEGDKDKLQTCLTIERHKDADSTGSWGFSMKPAHGTLVPELDETVRPNKAASWPNSLRIAMQALGAATEEHGIVKVDKDFPSCRIVSLQDWRTHCDNLNLTDSEKPDARQKAFKRARETLQQRGAIDIREGFVWDKEDA